LIQNQQKIRFRISCSRSCDMYLMSASEIDNLRQGRPFKFLWGQTQQTNSGARTYDIVSNIRNKVVLVAYNAGTLTLTAEFKFGWFIPTSSGSIWERKEFNEVIPTKGFHGRDFSKTAAEIRFTLTSDQNADMYLMVPEEIQNLRDGKPFNFLWSSLNTRSSQLQTYSDTTKISTGVVAVIVNSNSNTNINGNFVLEWRNASSPLSALFIIIIVIAVVCIVCCCCGFSGAAYGGKRYYYVQHHNSGYHSGYGNSGGNSYSGSIGGGSGGYGSGGGNSYSGSTGGGNSYN